MNKPKKKTGTTAIAVRPEESVVPPPTKRELLEATAMAVFRDNVARRNEAEKLYREKSAALDAAIHAWCASHVEVGRVNRDYYGPGNSHISVDIQFKVPNEGPLAELAKATHDARGAVQSVESYEQVLARLRKAQLASADRVSEILAAPGVAEALAKAGKRLLGIAEASQPSVTV